MRTPRLVVAVLLPFVTIGFACSGDDGVRGGGAADGSDAAEERSDDSDPATDATNDDDTDAPTDDTDTATDEDTDVATDDPDNTGDDDTGDDDTGDDDTGDDTTTTSADPVDPSAPVDTLVAPFDPAALVDGDLTATLAGLGFPAGWPIPESTAPVVGLSVRLGASEDGLYVTRSTAYRVPAAPLEDVVEEWSAALQESLGIESGIGSVTVTGQGLEGLTVSAGSDDEPAGTFSVTAVRPEGDDASAVTIEIRSETFIEQPGLTPTLVLDPALAAELPSLDGCDTIRADLAYDAYDTPNGFNDPPVHQIRYEGTCAPEMLDTMVEWARSRGVTISDSVTKFTDSVGGPEGSEIKVSAAPRDDGTVFVSIIVERPLDV